MGVLRCTEAFAFSDKGVERVVRPGDLVDQNDPLVKGREQWFETVEANVHRMTDRTVEQATAAPGEKRARRSRRSAEPAAPAKDDKADEAEAKADVKDE